jgi:TRAP-type mannitol/chloroaromatic compound transport system permease small subunit
VGLIQTPTGDSRASFPARLINLAGRSVAWLTLVMVLLTFSVVILRYGFNLGWIWLQESVTYMHATVFMLAAAWAWQTDDHVRVDIFYRDRTPHQKARVNLLGTFLFVIPFSVFLLLDSWEYVANSWAARETSREAGGLPFVYLQKSLIILLPLMLLLQASDIIRTSLNTLSGKQAEEV